MTGRFAKNPVLSPDKRATYAGRRNPWLDEAELHAPLQRFKPAVIGVQFMGDIFHEKVEESIIEDVFSVMGRCPMHTFVVLTKRDKRMQAFVHQRRGVFFKGMAFPNIIMGVSVEDQETANKRILSLLQTPAACRVVSLEPMLGHINLDDGVSSWLSCRNGEKQRSRNDGYCCESYAVAGECYRGIDWVICGSESGPGARPMKIEWARSVKDQCVAAGVPLFYKQGPGDDGVVCGMPVLDGQVWAQKPEREQP